LQNIQTIKNLQRNKNQNNVKLEGVKMLRSKDKKIKNANGLDEFMMEK